MKNLKSIFLTLAILLTWPLDGAQRPPQLPAKPTFLEMIKQASGWREISPGRPARPPLLSGSDQELKDSIISRYNASPSTCGAAITLSKRTHFASTRRLEMACLIQGSRTIVWETLQALKKELQDDAEYATFERVMKSESIKELDGVLFRPEGERNALLFLKVVNDPLLDINSYLVGSLLGYNPHDIEFYYQRWAFQRHLFKKWNIPMGRYGLPASYETFFPELKEEFDTYKADVWPQSEKLRSYELDKKNAAQWLEENKKFSNQQLYQQIQELKNKKQEESKIQLLAPAA